MRTFLAGSLTALALVLGGCGGSTEVAGGPRDAATLVPADATAYVGLDTDGDSEQWQRLEELLDRLGIRDELLSELLGELSEEGVDWERDVRPALGPSSALVFAKGNAGPVVLTRPDDRARLEALLDRVDPHPSTRDLDDGWVAIGEAEDELTRFDVVDERGSLADDDAFTSATDGLPEDAVAVFFYNGVRAPGWSPYGPGSAVPADVRMAAGAVEATEDGLHVVGTGVTDATLQTYEPTLLQRVPDDVVGALSFHGSDDLLDSLRGEEGALAPFLPSVEKLLDVRLDELLELLEGEAVVYVRPSIGVPEITLAVTTDDESAAAGAIDGLARGLGGTVETREVDGVEEHAVTVEGFVLTWAAFDGTLVVSTGRTAVGDFRADGDKLVDDEVFARAAEHADFDPDGETAGVVYADPEQLTRVAALFGADDVPDELQRALAALDGALVHVARDADGLRFEGFVGVPGS